MTFAVSLFTRPAMLASSFVSGEPSYSLLALPVVMVTVAGLTVRVPFSVVTFVKYAVLSSPALFLIT